MKKFLTMIGVALSAVVAVPAMAADMRPPPPVYRAPPPVVPIWTWTACYIGGHVGGLWARKEITDTTLGGPFFGEADHTVNGWLGGVQAGCDYQFAGGWVIGIQSDFAWTSADSSHVSVLDPTLTIETKIEWLGSLTGRIGYAWGRFLGYVKGGVAWEWDSFNVFDNVTLTSFGTLDRRRNGWTVGVGGEYAFADYLSGFVEYNYYDFGTRDFAFGIGSFDISETKSVVKAGLNFRFGGGFGKYPVAARY